MRSIYQDKCRMVKLLIPSYYKLTLLVKILFLKLVKSLRFFILEHQPFQKEMIKDYNRFVVVL
jgi:hypothetical protein